jgi:hypothetical protein
MENTKVPNRMHTLPVVRSLYGHHYHRPCCFGPLALIYSDIPANMRQDG